MTTLRWVKAFHLNLPKLDDDHRQLFDWAGTAILALQCGRWREAAQAIASLGDDARRHFRDEDDLMRSIGYPGYYNHTEQHRRLVLGLERLQVARAMRTSSPDDSVRYLRSWFTIHLLNDDRELSDYFRRKTG